MYPCARPLYTCLHTFSLGYNRFHVFNRVKHQLLGCVSHIIYCTMDACKVMPMRASEWVNGYVCVCVCCRRFVERCRFSNIMSLKYYLCRCYVEVHVIVIVSKCAAKQWFRVFISLETMVPMSFIIKRHE